MKLVTRRELIQEQVNTVRKYWDGQPESTSKRLTIEDLDRVESQHPTYQDFESLFSLHRYLVELKCRACGRVCEQVVEVAPSTYEGHVNRQEAVHLCGDCLIRALNVCEEEC